jgi:conjugative transposon TraM protein
MKRMKHVQQTQTVLRKRKLLLALPVLVIPFLTLAFWALGGGKSNFPSSTSKNKDGLNSSLPDASLKDETLLDKLGFYNKADKDSAKLAELMRSDPYYQQQVETKLELSDFELEQMTSSTASRYNQRSNVSPYQEVKHRPEDQLMKKLSLLQQQLETSATVSPKDNEAISYSTSTGLEGDVDRLESMMSKMSNGNGEDVEIKQLSNVMDKILDIRHPDRIKERMKEKQSDERSNVLPVFSSALTDTVVKGFYGLSTSAVSNQSNAIDAVVNENQVLVNGAVIKLRLLQPIYINEEKIPAGNFVFGLVSLNGERLEIEVNSIRCGSSVYPVKLEVYDMDGINGIYIPGAITRDVVKESADNSLQLMELGSFDPSLKAQAAAAGINTVKSLLSKKVKLVKVMVKAGYKVLLTSKL